MAKGFHFGIAERLAVLGIVLGLAGAIASVTVPLAYPDAFSPEALRQASWASLLVVGAGVLFGVCDLFVFYMVGVKGKKLAEALVILGTAFIAIGAVMGAIGAVKFDLTSTTDDPDRVKGPLKIRAAMFPFDYIDGIRSDNIVWHKSYSRSEVVLFNPLDEPIADLDAIFKPERPIIKSAVHSEFAKCQITSSDPPLPLIITRGPDGKQVFGTEHAPDDREWLIMDFHRLNCDKLAAHADIKIVFATIPGVVGNPMLSAQRNDPHFIDILVRYYVKGQKHEEQLRVTFSKEG
jgi:hypothetical protein